jgi:hypothetical protein
MKWLPASARGDDAAWSKAMSAYQARLGEIAHMLTPQLHELATDSRMQLNDGRFELVEVNLPKSVVKIVVECGDQVSGYRRVTLDLVGARVVPDNLHALAAAVGAEFRADHWRKSRSVTEILDQEIDVLPGGRFLLSLALFPFYEFSIEFKDVTVNVQEIDQRRRVRGGKFVLRQ